MDIPYGFDCYAFKKNEVKYFDRNLTAKCSTILDESNPASNNRANIAQRQVRFTKMFRDYEAAGTEEYVKFTRKDEEYRKDQLRALGEANRLNMSELDKRIFCGIKIQIGIGVVTNFLHKGLQYRPPIKGHSKLVNGSWTGIVKGLTIDQESPISYDVAVGNFLAYDEEFPYIKFGPFYAIESKLVMLTGRSQSIESSSFGTNINGYIWLAVLSSMLVLSLLATFRIKWEHIKHATIESVINGMVSRDRMRTGYQRQIDELDAADLLRIDQNLLSRRDSLVLRYLHDRKDDKSLIIGNTPYTIQHFFFIYYTMLLNKPSVEFDEFIWPKHPHGSASDEPQSSFRLPDMRHEYYRSNIQRSVSGGLDIGANNKIHAEGGLTKDPTPVKQARPIKRRLPTSVRIVSYLWSAVCFVMSSIYSGELLAVILLHADQNIDTITQLINSKPPIEPVIRQDDFTYNLMLKSLDTNMYKLHNMTKIIPRPEVYNRTFIEKISQRKQALLGDDELIETIYDIYHKYYPLYKSKMTYLQYPISIMYRKDLNVSLEYNLRRGIVQIFEMGLIHRWYQAQKDTYIQFYDSFEKKKAGQNQDNNEAQTVQSDQKYKPLSMHHFESFFRLMIYIKIFALFVLVLEIVHKRVTSKRH